MNSNSSGSSARVTSMSWMSKRCWMKNSAFSMNTARNAAHTPAMKPHRSKLPWAPNMPPSSRQAVRANQADNAKYTAMKVASPSMASQAWRLYAALGAVRFGGTSVGPGG